MKKVMSVVAVSALVLTAGVAFAGGPGKRGVDATPAGCAEECQQQIDELQSSQAQQNEQLAAQAAEIEALKNRDMYNPWYVRGAFKFGWGSQKDFLSRDIDNEVAYGGQAAIGKAFGSDFGDFRLEFEVGYQKADLDDIADGDVSLLTFMVNGYYDIPITDMFGFYLTVGAGYGNYNFNGGIMETPNNHINYVNHTNDVFAYKGGAGMTFNFTESMALDLGYEYLGTSDAQINNDEFTDIRSHNVVTSLRFMF